MTATTLIDRSPRTKPAGFPAPFALESNSIFTFITAALSCAFRMLYILQIFTDQENDEKRFFPAQAAGHRRGQDPRERRARARLRPCERAHSERQAFSS